MADVSALTLDDAAAQAGILDIYRQVFAVLAREASAMVEDSDSVRVDEAILDAFAGRASPRRTALRTGVGRRPARRSRSDADLGHGRVVRAGEPMTERYTALWWARIRSGGPQRVPPGGPTPAGLRRLVESDARAVWLLPNLPASASPEVLEEYGLPAAPVNDPKGLMRVLAACLRCCWSGPGAEIWLGIPAPLVHVEEVLARLTPDRDRLTRHRVLLGGVRRLAAAGWLRFDEGRQVVQIGARAAAWDSLELTTLRELWRLIPASERPTPGAAEQGQGDG